MKRLLLGFAVIASLIVVASTSFAAKTKVVAVEPPGEITLREIRYDGRLSDDEARFTLDVDAEVTGKTEAALRLFEGDLAVLPTKLPDDLKIVREGNRYLLNAARAGRYKFKLELVVKIQRVEPWNQINLAGPPAAIASVTARAAGTAMDVQLLSGTLLESARTNGVSRVKGFLGADQTISLRWQSKVTEVARSALLTVDTTVAAQITPTVVKYTTQFRYDIVQGNAPRLTLALPASQALTRLTGQHIRDWQLQPDGERQILTVEFIKPVEKQYDLTIFSEQTVEATPQTAKISPPQPLEVEREAGSLTLAAEDTHVEFESLAGLRQVNATGNALAAYRFNGRPFTLALKLKRIEPVINVADRVSVRLEETRLLVSHSLSLNVEKAGIYALDLKPQPGFVVADVRGEGVEDWKVIGDRLRVNFSTRVLEPRKLEVQLEQAQKNFPEQISVGPLRVIGANKETAQIGGASAAGIRLKTGELSSLREIPVNRLANRTDELLAFTAEQPDWKLSLASERLAARIVADVFNLVTIGDGLVGGSATIRYGLVNQGVQEFKVRLPAHCKNVEFTGPNIRRKELSGDIWTIGLQEKAWGGYTLVVTYDYQFDPKGATLPIGKIHPAEVERETGSVAVTTAASLQLKTKTVSDTLRRVDETELSAANRTLITRAVVLAYEYADGQYDLALDVKRHDEEHGIDAVADRTQLTSVLTDAGEMLTQASFMVKNNEKQFQKFQLPKNSQLWGCYVNNQPARPERDGDWVLVSLPRDANRDQSFAVDIVYAQTNGAMKSGWSQTLALAAPRTDVPNTYAEWQLYVPNSRRLSSFGGSMMVAQGTTYELLDAWQKFLAFYAQVLREAGAAILGIGVLSFLIIALVITAAKRGLNGVLTLFAVLTILGILSAMLLPALSKAKARAQRINSVNNLKQIGIAMRGFAIDNGDRFPMSFDEMRSELNNDKVTYDPESGQRYTYLAAGINSESISPDSVVAYSPIVKEKCNVLMADGSAQVISASKFAEYSQRGFIIYLPGTQIAQRQQASAVRHAQMPGSNAAAAVAAAQMANVTEETKPVVRGPRAIRIEIPREGKSFNFTKVLNIGNTPLSIEARMMSQQTFQTLQMIWQVAAFLLGLGVWWLQWRGRRNSFILTCALVLIIVSVGSLLIMWGALHDALIVGFPALVVAAIAWFVWRRAARRRSAPPIQPTTDFSPAGDMPPVAAAFVLVGLLSFGTMAQAQEAPQAPPVAVKNDPQPKGAVVKPETKLPVNPVSILTAHYSGTVNDRVAQLDATLQFSSAKSGQTIPLFGEDVTVQEFNVKGGDAKLVRNGKSIAVQLGKRGNVTLQVKALVKVAGDVTKRNLSFGIPPALSTQVAFTLDQPEADVDFPTAISFKRTAVKEQTSVEAVLGANERIELLWTPRVKRAAEVAATVFCQNTALVAFGGGVMNVRAIMDFQATQGELRSARVRLPAGQRLLRVEGVSIRTWETKQENDGQVVVVELLKGISPTWRLTLETEKVLDALPANVAVELPHALDVKRETGLVALRGAEELTLSVETVTDLQRVDAEEFAKASASKADGLVSVFRFLKPEFGLRARAESVLPQIEAVVRNNTRVNSDLENVVATVNYTIKRAGVFALRLALPAGYRLENVRGEKVQQWAERTENDQRILEVTLKERISGAYSLNVELVKSYTTLPKPLPIVGVHPLDTVKLTSFISVTANPGVAIKTESFDGLTEIPAATLPDYNTLSSVGSVLAFKYLPAEPKAAADWKLAVATETVESWVRAEIVNTITLSETLVSGRALVRYEIANAPVGELRLKTPASFKNVEITGQNIRRLDQTNDGWRVLLQSKTREPYLLTVTWEQPRPTKTNLVELVGVTADGVERETGLLAIVAKAPLQVTELTATDLKKVDTGDFPGWAGRPDEAMALAYRYVRPGYQPLALNVQRFDEAEVLQALVDNARFTTVVADDGQMMTEMSLSVRNNGRQFLEVELPAGAAVWSAFVAGQPVRPGKRDGKLLLPIEQTGADDAAMSVELTYVGTHAFPRGRGNVNLASPKFDVPLKNARWELYLPPDYNYEKFSGTMTREIVAPAATTQEIVPQEFSINFSSWDYKKQEKANQDTLRAEQKRDVSQAAKNLEGGNVRDAVANYNRARTRSFGNAAIPEDAGVKELEVRLNKFQATNLVNAQNDFVFRNNGNLFGNDGQAANPGGQQQLVYDNAAAEQQWAKLQAAQEVVGAKVQPLHVNLPVRGMRVAFTQVLQTELNKPLVIQLHAANMKSGNWMKRVGFGLAGFLGLWVAVAFVAARKNAMPESAAA